MHQGVSALVPGQTQLLIFIVALYSVWQFLLSGGGLFLPEYGQHIHKLYAPLLISSY